MDPEAALAELSHPQTLTLLTLTAPLLPSPNRRASASSTTSSEANTPTPALLAADLAHYRDLFAKLRFSYVEQVTKERFLRAVTADPPEFADGAENAELERMLMDEKAALKERKIEVGELVKELEEQGRSLSQRYENISLQKTQLATLPAELENLHTTIAALRAASSPPSSNPSLSLPLQPTLAHLAARESELDDINRRIEILRARLPAEKQKVEGLRQDLGPLVARKEEAVREATEARRRREVGGDGDGVEAKGRWMRGVEAGLRTMMEV